MSESTTTSSANAHPCVKSVAGLYAKPSCNTPLVSQLLFGERFETITSGPGGWLYGRAERDGYEGYLRSEWLGLYPESPTHWVRSAQSLVFREPDFKSPVLMALPCNAQVIAGKREKRSDPEHDYTYVAHAGGWVFTDSLFPVGQHEDPVQVAFEFLNAPYVWGGRTATGIDCSGLIQAALYAAGLNAPRDTGPQSEEVGELLGTDPRTATRGDLVFWKGHVGMMINRASLIHATVYRRRVVAEPLSNVITYRRQIGEGEITAIRRPGCS